MYRQLSGHDSARRIQEGLPQRRAVQATSRGLEILWGGQGLPDLHGIRVPRQAPGPTGEESSEGKTIGAASTVERGYKAPFAIIGEPSNSELHIESPGLFLFELTVLGKGAHTASRNLVIFPQRYGIPNGTEVGVDAITRMKLFQELFERLETQWNQRWRDELNNSGGYPLPVDRQGIGHFTINPSLIQGGTYLGAVPGYCKFTGNVWYPGWITQEEVIAELDRNIKAIASTDDSAACSADSMESASIMKFPPATPCAMPNSFSMTNSPPIIGITVTSLPPITSFD